MSESGRNPRNRGAALMLTLIFAMLISTVVVYTHTNTMNTAAMSSLRERNDAALAAADFVVETAVSNLSNMQMHSLNPEAPPGSPDEVVVDKDWVRIAPFFSNRSDQRRIGGTLDVGGQSMDYRVLVRSLRDARGHMPSSWLSDGFDAGDRFVFSDKTGGRLRLYGGTYEITASVRPSGGGETPSNPRLAVEASSKTLVTLRYQHPLNDQENLAVLNSDNLALLNPTPELKVSGEDHYGIKSVVQSVIRELVIQDIISIHGTDSQLFSMTSNSWSAGEQTLQFQTDPTGHDYNPHVPRTVNFSDGATDRSMISKSESLPQDKYVFGGKREDYKLGIAVGDDPDKPIYTLRYDNGRSVTFDDGDTEQSLIRETDAETARPDAQSKTAFAIGKFENFNRLYLNYTLPRPQRTGLNSPPTPTHPADDAPPTEVQTWKNKWEQLPLTYWSKAETRAGQYRIQIPLDNSSSPARRHMSTLFWIKNKEGKFLVRDYAYNDSPSPTLPTPLDDWNGYYIWSQYDGYNIWPEGHPLSPDTPNPALLPKSHKGRPYGNTQRIVHTRLLSLEELLGFVVTKGSDGLPARLDEHGNIVGGSPAFVLDEDGGMIPYRLTVNGNKTQFDEAAQRVDSDDNYGINTANIDDSRYPPRDGIYVVERDDDGNLILDPATGKPKVTVYRTMKDFAYELDIAPVGAEEPDLRSMATIQMVVEETPETHPEEKTMYFDMGICISVIYPKSIEEELKVDTSGGMDKYWWEGPAQETLTDGMSHNAVTAAPAKAVLEAETPEDKLRALYDYGFGGIAEGDADGIFTMVGDDGEKIAFKKAVLVTGETDPDIGKLLNTKDPDNPDLFYYVTRDDLYRVLAGMLKQEEKVTNEMLNNEPVLTNISLNYIRNLLANRGARFRMVDERYATDTGYEEAFVAGGHPSALAVADKYVPSRTFAGEVFGMLPQEVNGTYMVRVDGGSMTPATNADPGLEGKDLSVPERVKLRFLPGERLIVPGNNPEEERYDSPGGDFVPVVNQNHNTVQYNGQPLEPMIITLSQFNDNGSAFLHRIPSWINREDLRNGYGIREEISRSALGWHRNGPKFGDPLMQDHYVYAIAGEPGFMPYVLDNSGYVALIRDESFGMTMDERGEIEFRPMLKKPEDMPTFTIGGGPLDGAGILVVNGNLEISTEFAYHGTLVVMGDLIMRPAKMSLPRRNEYGLIVDKNGNVLLSDHDGYYYTRNQKRVDSEPEMVEQTAGSLVLQGQLFLGGGVRNREVDGMKGSIDIRGSRGALQDTTGVMFDGKEKRGIYRLLHSGVDNQKEIDELWEPGA